MDYARDLRTNKIVSADHANRWSKFQCARPGCGGRVYFPQVRLQRPHFRHNPGEGTPECDEYHPGQGGGSPTVNLSRERVPSGVEDDHKEFALQIEQTDFAWSLQLRFPDITDTEMSGTTLSALTRAFLEVKTLQRTHARLGALDVKPGSRASVFVPPESEYIVHALGEWPKAVPTSRWRERIIGVRPEGVIFRQYGGAWVRLRSDANLHTGEDLIVVADDRNPPPTSTILEKHALANGASGRWFVWLISLPESALSELNAWLHKLRRALVVRPCGIRPVTPPKRMSHDGVPVYLHNEDVIFELQAPAQPHNSTVSFCSAQRAEIIPGNVLRAGTSHICTTSSQTGLNRLLVFHKTNSSFDLKFEAPVDGKEFSQSETQFPRLKVSLDAKAFDASVCSSADVTIQGKNSPSVQIDVGSLGIRIVATVWNSSNSKRRVFSNLDSREAERIVSEHAASASKIILDAENLGLITINFLRPEAELDHQHDNRLEVWRSISRRASNPHEYALDDQQVWRSAQSFETRLTASDLLQQRRLIKSRCQKRGTPE